MASGSRAARETARLSRVATKRVSRVTANNNRVNAELSVRFGGEVPGLRVERPSLEDVYLAMISSAQPSGEKSA